MAHGNLNNDQTWFLRTKDGKFYVKDLLELFNPKNCPSLSNKPKLFIVQACEGEKEDEGHLHRDGLELDGPGDHYYIPTYADFLLAKASVQGYTAYRTLPVPGYPKLGGSQYIRTLCDVLEKEHKKEDLLGMLTLVGDRVADYGNNGCKKQMPSFISTLRRRIYFNV
ncbi:unnamed protein product [Darwinula stevensoni]|uniref:Uncharacterized protein n=1 Tax=Darwinula stevensoni TaxID=69355 RepID=A0A7R9AFA8_9CRUS|nr:unnamed protein product [Darwinula stevensoni]CAG0902804.1 unnamed protein product [Darwinula stevensoni]